MSHYTEKQKLRVNHLNVLSDIPSARHYLQQLGAGDERRLEMVPNFDHPQKIGFAASVDVNGTDSRSA
jgi:hypothetical protein